MNISIIFAAIVILLASNLSAQSCSEFTSGKKMQIEEFLKRSYQLPPNQAIRIEETSIDSACYRKLVFRASMSVPRLTAYLAPDGQHLVFGVIDLMVDPLIAQRRRDGDSEVHRQLLVTM